LVPIIGGRAGERILKIVHLELDVHVEQGGITACRNGTAEGVVIDRNIWLDLECKPDVSQSVDLGQNNNPNTTPTKDYEKVRVVVYLRGVQRGCAEEGERGSTPTG